MKPSSLKNLEMLKRASYGLGLVFLVFIGYFGVTTILFTLQDKEAKFAVGNLKRQIQETSREVDQAKRASLLAAKSDKDTIVDFQGMLQQQAAQHGVQIEFDSVTDPQIFISKYTNQVSEDWSARDLTVNLKASFAQTMAFLESCRSVDRLFEVSSMEIGREVVKSSGQAEIKTRVSFSIISKKV